MPLRTRKLIYMALAVVGSVVWLPISLLTIPVVGMGIFGLFALSALIGGIVVLPVARRVRSYYSIPIGMGVFAMGSLIAMGPTVCEGLADTITFIGCEEPVLTVPYIAGAVLLVVGIAVLIEMYFSPSEDDEDRAEETARPSGVESVPDNVR